MTNYLHLLALVLTACPGVVAAIEAPANHHLGPSGEVSDEQLSPRATPAPAESGFDPPDPEAPIPPFDHRLIPEINRPFAHWGFAPRGDSYQLIDDKQVASQASFVVFGINKRGTSAGEQLAAVNGDCKCLSYTHATKWTPGARQLNYFRWLDARHIDRRNGFLFVDRRFMNQRPATAPWPNTRFHSVVVGSKWRTGDASNAKNFPGPRSHEALWIGRVDPFHVVHLKVARLGAAAKWHYTTGTNDNGELVGEPIPTAAIVQDTTVGGSKSGTLEINAEMLLPTWTPGRRPGPAVDEEDYLFCLYLPGTRFPPQYQQITGRQFFEKGSPPLFDERADTNGDDFLSPDERTAANPEKTAIWHHESRWTTQEGVWVVDLSNRFARQHIIQRDVALGSGDDTDGLLYDVADPKFGDVEGKVHQTWQGSLYREVWKRLPPGKLVMINVSGWKAKYNPWLVQWCPSLYLDRTWHPRMTQQRFREIVKDHRWRYELAGGRLLTVLDWLGGDDFTLSEQVKYAGYCAYLLHGLKPHTDQYLAGGFNGDWKRGGGSGRSEWLRRHWAGASAERAVCRQELGQPLGDTQEDEGLFFREFAQGWVYYFPFGGEAQREATLPTAAQPVAFDGSVGAPVRQFVLQAGEGRVLAK